MHEGVVEFMKLAPIQTEIRSAIYDYFNFISYYFHFIYENRTINFHVKCDFCLA